MDICINEGHKINCFQIFDEFSFSKSGKIPVEFLLVRKRKVRSKSAETWKMVSNISKTNTRFDCFAGYISVDVIY